jgi:hypothetical protein
MRHEHISGMLESAHDILDRVFGEGSRVLSQPASGAAVKPAIGQLEALAEQQRTIVAMMEGLMSRLQPFAG